MSDTPFFQTRKGNSGRVPNAIMDTYEKYPRINITLPPELEKRLTEYSVKEERAKSWVIQKALEDWLSKKGY